MKKLCLRQNYISKLDAEDFAELGTLEELDFYDNKLKRVGDALDNLKNLRYVIQCVEHVLMTEGNINFIACSICPSTPSNIYLHL